MDFEAPVDVFNLPEDLEQLYGRRHNAPYRSLPDQIA